VNRELSASARGLASTIPPHTSWPRRALREAAALVRGFAARRRARARRAADLATLHAMDQRELNDLGIARAEATALTACATAPR